MVRWFRLRGLTENHGTAAYGQPDRPVSTALFRLRACYKLRLRAKSRTAVSPVHSEMHRKQTGETPGRLLLKTLLRNSQDNLIARKLNFDQPTFDRNNARAVDVIAFFVQVSVNHRFARLAG